MFNWVLNTPLVQVLKKKRLTECQYLSDTVKVDSKICHSLLVSRINKACWFNKGDEISSQIFLLLLAS